MSAAELIWQRRDLRKPLRRKERKRFELNSNKTFNLKVNKSAATIFKRRDSYSQVKGENANFEKV